MQQGGDRGKSPNVTGTQPKPELKKSPNQAGERSTKHGTRQGTGKVSQKGPKKLPQEPRRSLGTSSSDYA